MTRSGSLPAVSGGRELHLLGVLDDPRGAQDFEADHAPILAEIGDHTRADLVALSDRRIPQRDEQRIGLAIVDHFQGNVLFRYFAICDVL